MTPDTAPKTMKKKLTDAQKIGVLAGMLLWVIKGLRNKSVKSKPIFSYKTGDITDLESEIWDALKQVGITERKEEKAK